jgi:decaprenylphospho-beta-D-erythro-pentofuranosid-2-ulose 2-reductase
MKVVILGALSAIAQATARRLAAEKAQFVLVARDADELGLLAEDLKVRGASEVSTATLDLGAGNGEGLEAQMEGAGLVLLAYGALTDQRRAETDMGYAAEQLRINFTSAALWSLAAANVLARQKSGVLVVIGSVAGDRGRQSNYVYGAAKSGLAALVQGLAHRLAGTGAHAVVIKPGFIDSPMTAHLDRKGPLWSKPDAVARVILKATTGKTAAILYAPPFWYLILLIIRLLPEAIFHRSKL